jgi:hypothetical protein
MIEDAPETLEQKAEKLVAAKALVVTLTKDIKDSIANARAAMRPAKSQKPKAVKVTKPGAPAKA